MRVSAMDSVGINYNLESREFVNRQGPATMYSRLGLRTEKTNRPIIRTEENAYKIVQ